MDIGYRDVMYNVQGLEGADNGGLKGTVDDY